MQNEHLCTQNQENPIWIVIEFQRNITFPKFSMAKDDCWRFKATSRRGIEYEKALNGESDRFEFAGGQCLMMDVKEVYRGENPHHIYGFNPLSL